MPANLDNLTDSLEVKSPSSTSTMDTRSNEVKDFDSILSQFLVMQPNMEPHVKLNSILYNHLNSTVAAIAKIMKDISRKQCLKLIEDDPGLAELIESCIKTGNFQRLREYGLNQSIQPWPILIPSH